MAAPPRGAAAGSSGSIAHLGSSISSPQPQTGGAGGGNLKANIMAAYGGAGGSQQPRQTAQAHRAPAAGGPTQGSSAAISAMMGPPGGMRQGMYPQQGGFQQGYPAQQGQRPMQGGYPGTQGGYYQ